MNLLLATNMFTLKQNWEEQKKYCVTLHELSIDTVLKYVCSSYHCCQFESVSLNLAFCVCRRFGWSLMAPKWFVATLHSQPLPRPQKRCVFTPTSLAHSLRCKVGSSGCFSRGPRFTNHLPSKGTLIFEIELLNGIVKLEVLTPLDTRACLCSWMIKYYEMNIYIVEEVS